MPVDSYENEIQKLYSATKNNVELRDTQFKDITDKKIIIGFMQQYSDKYPSMLQHVAPTLQNNVDVVMSIITKWPSQLQYASKSMQGNRSVVLAAVNKNGMVLQYAAQALRADKEVVGAAVRQNPNALQYVDEQLRTLLTTSPNGAIQPKADSGMTPRQIGFFIPPPSTQRKDPPPLPPRPPKPLK